MNSNDNDGCSNASNNTRPLAIEGPRFPNVPNDAIEIVPNQPRQPSNLQGLLRFAMEATRSEDAPHSSQFQPLDQETKDFLNAALSSMTINLVEELQNAMKTLLNVNELRSDDDPTEHELALERIADFVGNIDLANDFYKIGGFPILKSCLNSTHSSIRWRAAEIIAELTQNNPFCQEKILEAELMPILLNMVDSDESELARIKALYAVSCLVRGHPDSLKYFDNHDGYSVLLRAMQSSIEKLQIKSAFFLSSLCNKENTDTVKATLVKMGLVEQIAGLLAMQHLLPDTREQLLMVLAGLVDNDYLPALEECRRSDLCLKQTLEKYVNEAKLTGAMDEVYTCNNLFEKVFCNQETDQER
ncbi:hsp70-binding protein 1 isoform X2 [Orussus abietinus]|nr:hsp70-binding protein 1 isoform X2 [Orussus abietinus]XP_012285894.1 hsp70-binding protein 1 isoform X2 [Orussus abietinus]